MDNDCIAEVGVLDYIRENVMFDEFLKFINEKYDFAVEDFVLSVKDKLTKDEWEDVFWMGNVKWTNYFLSEIADYLPDEIFEDQDFNKQMVPYMDIDFMDEFKDKIDWWWYLHESDLDKAGCENIHDRYGEHFDDNAELFYHAILNEFED